MKAIRYLLEKLQEYRQFRIFYANIYPSIKKLGIIDTIKKIFKEAYSDPWSHNKDIKYFGPLIKKYSVDFKKLITLKKNYTIGFLMYPEIDRLNNIKNACNSLGIKYKDYDIRNPSLYTEIRESDCDGIFLIPAHVDRNIRDYFHEAAQILNTETKIIIYPTLRELNIYESKRTLINFLVINNIPHPATTIFYDYESARKFIEGCRFPMVFKTHVGSSANGVEILKNKRQALKLSKQLFNKYYMRKMETEKRNTDWGYLLIQEYIENVKEYRIIKIGDSWFGHQKWKANNQIFLSGSGFAKWINPSEGLLDFCYDIAAKYHFTTMCFDIFENNQGDLLVNELQTWFGSYNPSQMYLEDGTPGRYRKLNGNWVFEAGLFNVYGSILLRLIEFISFIQQEK